VRFIVQMKVGHTVGLLYADSIYAKSGAHFRLFLKKIAVEKAEPAGSDFKA
jgi:hypothetical protein